MIAASAVAGLVYSLGFLRHKTILAYVQSYEPRPASQRKKISGLMSCIVQ